MFDVYILYIRDTPDTKIIQPTIDEKKTLHLDRTSGSKGRQHVEIRCLRFMRSWKCCLNADKEKRVKHTRWNI